MGVALLESTSILPILILPWYSVASSSTMGAMARQGPHQVAQKSTRTGLSDFKTSWSKFASVTSTIPLPAIFFLLVVKRRAIGGAAMGAALPGDRMSASRKETEPFTRTPYRNTAIGCLGRWESRKNVSPARTGAM